MRTCSGRVADRVDYDLLRPCLPQPMLVRVGRARGRISAPDQNAVGGAGCSRIKPAERVAENCLQRDVSRLVAHGVGIDFHRSDPIEEAQWEPACDQRAGARIVAVDDAMPTSGVDDPVEARGHDAQRFVPLDRLKLRLALVADAAKGRLQPCCAVTPSAIIDNGTLTAENTATYRVFGIAEHARFAPPFDHYNPARIVAITRTSGPDHLFVYAIRHHL
jgi:hypothetical protein